MMSAGEICREFRLAKDRKKQISILSQINLTSAECTALILFEHGEIQKTPEKAMLEKVLDVLENAYPAQRKSWMHCMSVANP